MVCDEVCNHRGRKGEEFKGRCTALEGEVNALDSNATITPPTCPSAKIIFSKVQGKYLLMMCLSFISVSHRIIQVCASAFGI
jgi:hypothetical protein